MPMLASVVMQQNSPQVFIFEDVISASMLNYNVRTRALAAGWNPLIPLQATIQIDSGIYVGSYSSATLAFDTGALNVSADVVTLINNGVICGPGGKGGNGNQAGSNGGPALIARSPLKVINNGVIGGGGGGGGGSRDCSVQNVLAGGAGGGGGQGYNVGPGGTASPAYAGAQYPKGGNGTAGTLSSYGTGGNGTRSGIHPNQYSAPYYCYSGNAGRGGALGENGVASQPGTGSATPPGMAGGLAGDAVRGNAYIEWVVEGTILGNIVN